MFYTLWRDRFRKELAMMNRRDLRVATQLLTGHAALNYHLSKLNRTVEPSCPLCGAEEETVSHFLGQCPAHGMVRVEYFNTYYTTASEIVDSNNLRQIIRYVNKTNRLELRHLS